MAQTKTELDVFVSSPDDVNDEKIALEEIVSELNNRWINDVGIRLNLIRWDTYCHPSMGSDPQAIINEQIGDNYDIFMGILWKKFGTPTPRAGSGTVEEFNKAYERYCENPESVEIMFYFKSTPVSPSELDPTQLGLIKTFRDNLGKQGLYWTYNSLDEFKMFVRQHLAQVAKNWQKIHENEDIHKSTEIGIMRGTGIEPNININTPIDLEEEGFLDLIELGEDDFERLNEVVIRIKDAIETIGNKMKERAAELETAKDPSGRINIKAARRITNHAAEDVEQFYTKMNAEVPLFSSLYSEGIDAFGRAATISNDFNPENENELINALDVTRQLKGNLEYTRGKMISFRDVIASSPRISTKFNRAKRQSVKIMDQFITEMTNAESITSEVGNVIEKAIDEYKTRYTNSE